VAAPVTEGISPGVTTTLSDMRVTHRAERSARSRGWWLVVVLLGFALGACSSSTPSSAPNGSTVATGASALLTRLTVEGSDAAFERRFSGDLDGGGEAGAFVFAGITGDQAVVYVCDGTSGAWFTGTVAADGAGTLRATDGDGSVTVAPGADGVRVTFDGGTFGGRAAHASQLDVGDAQLVRLEATPAAGGATAEVGGIIITPAGIRGTFVSSVKDGTSNTLLVRERTSCATPTRAGTPVLGDGSVRTVNVGETCPLPGTGTACAPGTTLADGTSNTLGGTCVPPAACNPNAGADGNATSADASTGCTLPGPACPPSTPPPTLGDGTSRTIDPGSGCPPPPTCPSPSTTATSVHDGNSNTIILGEDCAPPVACPRSGTPTPSLSDGSTRTVNPGAACNPACPSPSTTIRDGNSNTIDLGEGCVPPAACPKTAAPPPTLADGSSRTINVGETPPGCTQPGTSAPTASSTTATTATTAKPAGLVTVVSKTSNGLLTIRVGAAPATSTTTTSSAATCVASAVATADVVRSLTDTAKALKTQLDLLRRQRDQLAAEAKQATGADKDALQKKVTQLERSIANAQKQLDNVSAQIDELHRVTPSCAGKGQPTSTK
jgi:hypothetical protein